MWTILRIPRFFLLFLLLLCGIEAVLMWQIGVHELPFLHIKSMQASAPTTMDAMYAGLIGICLALLLTGFSYLTGEARERALEREATLSGVGLIVSVLVLLCPVCNLGIFVFFGLALNLQFLVPYIPALQIVSIVCLAAALYFMDYRIKHACRICVGS